MTNKEKINKVSDADAGELLANHCYNSFLKNLCLGNCSECYSKWLSSEVKENEVTKSN